MTLTAIDIDLLRLCAFGDWTSPEAREAWAEHRARHGAMNEHALLTRLYLLRLVDASNRITFAGRVELWAAELQPESTRLAS